jgi:hypothetical protein
MSTSRCLSILALLGLVAILLVPALASASPSTARNPAAVKASANVYFTALYHHNAKAACAVMTTAVQKEFRQTAITFKKAPTCIEGVRSYDAAFKPSGLKALEKILANGKVTFKKNVATISGLDQVFTYTGGRWLLSFPGGG